MRVLALHLNIFIRIRINCEDFNSRVRSRTLSVRVHSTAQVTRSHPSLTSKLLRNIPCALISRCKNRYKFRVVSKLNERSSNMRAYRIALILWALSLLCSKRIPGIPARERGITSNCRTTQWAENEKTES
uniref:Uncharacterized protein n=1 Tax=Timspurckia oligopyrenoides TaxID=708627 RepID=A0A7S1EV19_9RHOD